MNPGTSDNSRLGVAAVVGGLVLLAAIALGLIANAVNNSGPPTPSKPTPTHGPCATCIATPLPTKPLPTQVPTFPAPVPSEEPTQAPTAVPTVPAPIPTDLPTAQPTAPEPVPTK